MLERMQNVLKNRKAEGDKGFSLVELAVVIVVIGILVAIAIPVFGNITKGAEQANIEAAAANGASIVATNIAAGETNISTGLGALSNETVDSVALKVGSGTSIDDFCVVATPVAGKGTGPVEKGTDCS